MYFQFFMFKNNDFIIILNKTNINWDIRLF